MTGSTVAGLIVVKNPKPSRVHPPGKLPAATCREWRQRVLKALASAGDFTAPQICQILGTPERTIRRDVASRSQKKATGGKTEAPGQAAAAARPQPDAPRQLTADEIRDLRRSFAGDDSPGVKAFLASLAPEADDRAEDE